MITADIAARAIVTAARLTGEDPLIVGTPQIRVRCRHYAMHALAQVFPGYQRQAYARMVGCPGRADDFWKNSRNMIFEKAHWWRRECFDRVVDAISPTKSVNQESAATLAERKIIDEDRVPFRMAPINPTKKALNEMLAEAARNTAALPKGN